MLPQYRSILYATDLSEGARQALNHAAAVADRFDGDLTVLHVLPDSLEQYSEEAGMDLAAHFGEEAAYWLDKGERGQAAEAIHRRLEGMVRERFAHPNTGVHLANAEIRVVSGEPAGSILDQSGQGDFDLVVMGTRGHGGLLGLVLGSVARQVITHSSVPVLVVPLPGEPDESE